jgi:hypothetical protein
MVPDFETALAIEHEVDLAWRNGARMDSKASSARRKTMLRIAYCRYSWKIGWLSARDQCIAGVSDEAKHRALPHYPHR